MSFIAAGGVVLSVGAGLYESSQQSKQAAALAKSNPYPTETVPQSEKDNQLLARQMSNVGLPSQEYANAMKNIQRSRTAAMRSANDRRSGIGLISQIQQGTDDATGRLDAQNAQARMQNQRSLMNTNSQAARYEQGAFDWNYKNRYNQNYQYAQQLKGASNANMIGAIDSGLSGLVNLSGRGLFSGNKNSSGGYAPPPDLSGISDDELSNYPT